MNERGACVSSFRMSRQYTGVRKVNLIYFRSYKKIPYELDDSLKNILKKPFYERFFIENEISILQPSNCPRCDTNFDQIYLDSQSFIESTIVLPTTILKARGK